MGSAESTAYPHHVSGVCRCPFQPEAIMKVSHVPSALQCFSFFHWASHGALTSAFIHSFSKYNVEISVLIVKWPFNWPQIMHCYSSMYFVDVHLLTLDLQFLGPPLNWLISGKTPSEPHHWADRIWVIDHSAQQLNCHDKMLVWVYEYSSIIWDFFSTLKCHFCY